MVDEILKVANFNAYFGNVHVLKNVNCQVRPHEILGAIGPSNSGKTTFLRALNKLNYLQVNYREKGDIFFNGRSLRQIDDGVLRKKVGIIFALPQVLPISIYDNVAYGPKVHGMRGRTQTDEIVEKSLQKAYLWNEVKDRLKTSAVRLSGGQQQRLCIARTLAVGPEIILYDEPCSGLDPISTARIEEAMRELKASYTQILVTNNTKQAARVSDRCAFFLMGELVEMDETAKLFTSPADKRTDDYISGRFG